MSALTRLQAGDLAMYVGRPGNARHPVHQVLCGKVVTLTQAFFDGQWMWLFAGEAIPVPGGCVDALADRALVPLLRSSPTSEAGRAEYPARKAGRQTKKAKAAS